MKYKDNDPCPECDGRLIIGVTPGKIVRLECGFEAEINDKEEWSNIEESNKINDEIKKEFQKNIKYNVVLLRKDTIVVQWYSSNFTLDVVKKLETIFNKYNYHLAMVSFYDEIKKDCEFEFRKNKEAKIWTC